MSERTHDDPDTLLAEYEEVRSAYFLEPERDNEYNEHRDCYQLIVSHGVDLETGCGVVLPQVHPDALGAVIDYDLGEYVIRSQ